MIIRRLLGVVCLCLLPAGAFAQDDRGAVVSGSVSATNMESHTDVAFGGTFGYRFSRVFGMEIEVTAVPVFKAPFPDEYPNILASASSTLTGSPLPITQIFPGPVYANPGGRVVIFTNNGRIEIPTLSSRVTPYFVAGGGVASIRRTAEFTYGLPLPILPTGQVLPPPRPITFPVVSNATALALTIGGGVDVRVMKRLAVEADLRLFRLFGSEDENLGRFGAGVRYRF